MSGTRSGPSLLRASDLARKSFVTYAIVVLVLAAAATVIDLLGLLGVVLESAGIRGTPG